MNISNFLKTHFFNITLTFIGDFTLNLDDIKEFRSFEVLDFAGLCWLSLAFLAFMTLDKFLQQKLAFFDKN